MTIIAAVDRSERSGPVINQAKDLADTYGEPLHVVHVADLAEASGKDELGGPKLELDKAQNTAVEVARAAADAQLGPREYEAVGLVGDTAYELIEHCEAEEASYIVVCGRKRSSIGRVVFGSVTQELLLNATTPVVCVADPQHQEEK